MIDQIDRRILSLLQEHARIPNAQIARQIGMAASGTFERIRKLEDREVILGYETRLDPKVLRRGLVAFVFVRSEDIPRNEVTGRELARIPDVLEVHNIAGEDCFLLKVRVSDPEHLARLIREEIAPIDPVISTRTVIALETIKETTKLPLDSDEREEGVARPSRRAS